MYINFLDSVDHQCLKTGGKVHSCMLPFSFPVYWDILSIACKTAKLHTVLLMALLVERTIICLVLQCSSLGPLCTFSVLFAGIFTDTFHNLSGLSLFQDCKVCLLHSLSEIQLNLRLQSALNSLVFLANPRGKYQFRIFVLPSLNCLFM